MSKKQFRSQASSGRAAFGAGAGASFGNSFGGSAFGASSPLSWIAEPPDLSGFSDPNVAGSIKNLTKKDSTTKAKALEDLQSYFTSPDQQVDEAVLEAWVRCPNHLTVCRRVDNNGMLRFRSSSTPASRLTVSGVFANWRITCRVP